MKRVPIKRYTPLPRSRGPIRRSPKQPTRPRVVGFTDQVKAFVRRRSGNVCEVRAEGCSRRAAHFHHRKLRGHGDHRDVNCLHVCAWCHEVVHRNPELSYAMGWLVAAHRDPDQVPVLHGAG